MMTKKDNDHERSSILGDAVTSMRQIARTPKPIEHLTDTELQIAVYGEDWFREDSLVRVLTPDRRKDLRYRLGLQANQLSAEALHIDTLAAPYNVPCPVCLAFALAPCMSEPRDPSTLSSLKPMGVYGPNARVIGDPHPERQEHYDKNPGMRVTATRS